MHVRGLELISDLNSAEKVILVTIHNGISLSIIRMLKDIDKESCLIAADTDQTREFSLYSCDYEADVIKRSKYVFLKARDKLKQRKWIVCYADEMQEEAGLSNGELLMGTGIFDFAHKMGAHLIFCLAQVSNNGEIDIKFGRPDVGSYLSSNEMAKKFISFLDSALVVKKRWKVGRWQHTPL
jgi:hypothetical protein